MAAAAVGAKRTFVVMSGDDVRTVPTPDSRDLNAPGNLNPSKSRRVSMEGMSSKDSSALNTARNTPAPTSSPREWPRTFRPDASIVLIGLRGTGTSTLAVIASIACRRRVVDIDDLFQNATGFSTAKYRKQFGAGNHNLRQDELLHTALRTHDNGAIIVCNGGSLERNGQMLMQDFARTHPVIHVLRDFRSVHDYLGGIDPQKLKDMLAFSAPILRSCSNFEFYNISETNVVSSVASKDQSVTPAFLTLKRTQRTFLKLLSLITSHSQANGVIGASIPPLESGYPLSDVATELRRYTCAVQVPLKQVLAENVDFQRLELGCDAFEVVIDSQQHPLLSDADKIGSGISRIRRSTVVPIIYHVPPVTGLGGDRAVYIEHVLHGLRMAPEFATVDLSLDHDILMEVITARGITKIIGHLHDDKSWIDTSWTMHYERAIRLGCAAVRFSRPASSVDEDDLVQSFRSKTALYEHQIPLICYNTGRKGRRSVCFNRYLTPVVPVAFKEHADFTTTMEHSPQKAWLTAREVTQALYTSFTFDSMRLYIIGARLDYTVSPAMHNAAYDACGMPHQFIRVQSHSLNTLRELVHNPNFGGSIVIQPFKLEVISLADSLSQHARAIGAVNTLIPVRNLRADGSVPSDLDLFQERNQAGPVQALYGDNTEWIGIRSCVRRGLSPANAVRPSTCGLVVGAGGMARAAVYALLQLGVRNIVIFNRTYTKAEKLVEHFGRFISTSTGSVQTTAGPRTDIRPDFSILKARDDPWPENYRHPTIILSCIPVDSIDGSPAAHFTLPKQWMDSPTGGVVMEMAYKTLNTPLMQQVQLAASNLWTYMDGLDFIPEQAFAQFELFTGKRAPRRVMREEVLRAWRDEQGNADPEMAQRRLKAIDDQEL